jgi:hypothetical protein
MVSWHRRIRRSFFSSVVEAQKISRNALQTLVVVRWRFGNSEDALRALQVVETEVIRRAFATQSFLKMKVMYSLEYLHNSVLPGCATLLPIVPEGNEAQSSHPFFPALSKNSMKRHPERVLTTTRPPSGSSLSKTA